MSALDTAIARLQNILAACTSVTFKSAKDYPVDNVEPFPLAVAYYSSGSFHFANASMVKHFPVIALELHFSRVNILQAYQQINAIAIELPKRLAGDPTLDGNVATILATADNPMEVICRPYQWSPAGVTPVITSQMLLFNIPVKLLEAPESTST